MLSILTVSLFTDFTHLLGIELHQNIRSFYVFFVNKITWIFSDCPSKHSLSSFTRAQIRAALNQQTIIQFRQVAVEKYPKEPSKVSLFLFLSAIFFIPLCCYGVLLANFLSSESIEIRHHCIGSDMPFRCLWGDTTAVCNIRPLSDFKGLLRTKGLFCQFGRHMIAMYWLWPQVQCATFSSLRLLQIFSPNQFADRKLQDAFTPKTFVKFSLEILQIQSGGFCRNQSCLLCI